MIRIISKAEIYMSNIAAIIVLLIWFLLFGIEQDERQVILGYYFAVNILFVSRILLSFVHNQRLKKLSYSSKVDYIRGIKYFTLFIGLILHIGYWYSWVHKYDFRCYVISVLLLLVCSILPIYDTTLYIGDDYFAYCGKKFTISKIHKYSEGVFNNINLIVHGYKDESLWMISRKNFYFLLEEVLVKHNCNK